MNRIQILPPAIAERIAAGEVIERPSSVVKELVENSIDAGATEINVMLEDGGKQLIEVTDNGRGMIREDLKLSVQRHATSKLRSLEELEKILTLGFRGEALPSIAAVSDLSILSRGHEDDSVHELKAAAPGMARTDDDLRKVTFGHFLNSPHGTRIQARGLFSQVPARLKFLKSQASEVAQVREWIERVALAHPKIGFKLVSNDRTILNLRPDSDSARIQAILAEDNHYPLVEARSEGAGYKIRLYWFQGLSLPSSKKLLQVVNGRSVRDKLLQQATMSGFRQSLLPGQFPAVALFVEIDPGLIDVNVHPTKTEIRFLNSGEIFRAVNSLIDASLVKHGAPNYVPEGAPTSSSSSSGSGWAGWTAPAAASTPSLWTVAEVTDSTERPHPLSYAPYLGTLFGTYFVFDDKTEMVLVDQHAAHERIRYETLKSRMTVSADSRESQSLLVPEPVKFAPEHRPTLESKLPLLAQLGFESELFSEDTVLFRGIPVEWGTQELRTRLKGLIDRLIDTEPSRELLWDETLFEKIASEACHSAIRAGDRVDTYQALEIVGQLFRCEHPWNCPHGRPTVVRIPRGKLEEWFQRRV